MNLYGFPIGNVFGKLSMMITEPPNIQKNFFSGSKSTTSVPNFHYLCSFIPELLNVTSHWIGNFTKWSIESCIAGIVCKVLNCANYARGCELAFFNSAVICNKFCFIHASSVIYGLEQYKLIWYMGVAFEVSRRHAELHEFAKQLMAVARRIRMLVASLWIGSVF